MRYATFLVLATLFLVGACGDEGKPTPRPQPGPPPMPCPHIWGATPLDVTEPTPIPESAIMTRPQILARILRKVAAVRLLNNDVIMTQATFARIVKSIGTHLVSQNVNNVEGTCNDTFLVRALAIAESAGTDTDEEWLALFTKLEQGHPPLPPD
jgi:hypothetical protein